MCIYIYIYVYICIYRERDVYIYIYIYILICYLFIYVYAYVYCLYMCTYIRKRLLNETPSSEVHVTDHHNNNNNNNHNYYVYIYIYTISKRAQVLELWYSYPYPCPESSTDIMLYPFVIQRCSTNWLGHGHGYEWHSSIPILRSEQVRHRTTGHSVET